MALLRLPNELIQDVAERLWEESDINALLRANRRLYNLLDPYLYSHHMHRHELGEVWENRTVLIRTVEESGSQRTYGKALKACMARDTPKCKEVTWRAYYRAIERGCADLVKIQLAIDDALNSVKNPNIDQWPIIRSCTQKNDDVFFALVDSGLYDVNSNDHNGSTALLEACSRNYMERIRFLLNHGADVGAGEQGGNTALHRAAEQGNIEALKMLLATGKVNINARNCEGFTALGRALDAEKHEAALLLASQPSMNPFLRDNRGYEPIQLAVIKKDDELKLLKTMVEAGADVNYESDESVLPLIVFACARGCVDAVRYLLSIEGIQLNPCRRGISFSSLEVATRQGSVGVIEALLGHPDIDANAQQEGKTALVAAVEGCCNDEDFSSKNEVVEMLMLSGKVNVNKQCSGGESALTAAIVRDCARMVRRLLEVPEIDPELKNLSGQTPLDLAVQMGRLDCVKLLLDHEKVANGSAVRAANNPYEMAERDGKKEMLDLLRPYYERRLGQL